MNPVELPTATDPGQGGVLTPPLTDARPLALRPPVGTPTDTAPVTPAPPKVGRPWLLHGFVVVVLLLELLPLYMLFQTSLRDDPGYHMHPWLPPLPGRWHLAENFSYAWGHLWVIRNTLNVALLTTLLTLGAGLPAAYGLARHRGHPAARWLWAGYVGALLLPTVVGVVPLVGLMRGLGLGGSLLALVLLGAAGGQAVAVGALREAVGAIPESVWQAAELDCIKPWQRLRHVVLPACGPTLGVLAVLTFVGSWNEFVLPGLLLSGSGHETLGAMLPGLAAGGGAGGPSWGQLSMFYLLAALPVMCLGVWTLPVFVRALTRPAR